MGAVWLGFVLGWLLPGATAVGQESVGTVEIANWFNAADAAVSLTFDDGHPTGRTFAAPALEAIGVRGSYYLHGSDADDDDDGMIDAPELAFRVLAQNGHELGGHSATHSRSILTAGPMRISQEISLGNSYVNEILTHGSVQTFAYPFGRPSPELARQAGAAYLASRIVGGPSLINAANPTTMARLSSFSVRNVAPPTRAPNLIARAIVTKSWAIFTFHDVDELDGSVSGMTTTRAAWNALLNRLSADRRRLWVAPVAEVASYIRARTSPTIDSTVVDADRIEVRIQHTDARLPQAVRLTAEVVVPASWPGAVVTEDGGPAKMHRITDSRVLLNVFSDGRRYSIVRAP